MLFTLLTYLLIKPRLSHLPLPSNRGRPYPENLGSLFDRETSKEAELDDLAFLRIELSQPFERLIQSHALGSSFVRQVHGVIKRHLNSSASALCREATASIVNQDAPHHLSSDPKKMGAILPGDILIDQPEIRLVDQGRWLQRVIRTFSSQIMTGQATQLVVNQGQEPIESLRVAIPRGYKELRNLIGLGRRHIWPIIREPIPVITASASIT